MNCERRICVVTGTRAEYGLLRWVMQGVADTPEMTLQVIATGTHVAPGFGLTYRAIEQDGFRIDRKIEMLLDSDSPVGIAKSMGVALIGFADALEELRPDILVVLGDRFELLPVVSAALVGRIPVAHVHGGETSEGSLDESIRHAITKLSHLHFVAAEEYRRRVIQLGESPDRVFLVGGLGIDNIRRLKLLSRSELEAALQFELAPRLMLITFHPPTLEERPAAEQMVQLLDALGSLEGTSLVFTAPNADAEGRALHSLIRDFCASHSHARLFESLGQLLYLSCMRHADAVVGNSSSGLIEAPALRRPTINIGERQRGRIRASSVIECPPDSSSIVASIERAYSKEFQRTLEHVESPYGDGGASEKVVAQLRRQSLDGLLVKSFRNLDGVW